MEKMICVKVFIKAESNIDQKKLDQFADAMFHYIEQAPTEHWNSEGIQTETEMNHLPTKIKSKQVSDIEHCCIKLNCCFKDVD